MKNKAIIDLLVCPKNHDRVVASDFGFKSTSGITYDEINGLPVLIDFEKSVIDKSTLKEDCFPIERPKYSGLKAMLKQIISPASALTKNNVDFLLESLPRPSRVLIVGGGTIGQGLQKLYASNKIELVSFDVYATNNIDFIADGHDIPIKSESFDLVVVQAVLEHVLDPARVVSEIHRVLKKEGVVYSETPFLQQVHEGAYDFTRFTESGHRYLFRQFKLLKSGALQGAGSQMLWTLDNFFRGVFRSRLVGKIVKTLFFWLRFFDGLIPEPYNIDSACGVYFIGRKSTDVLSGRDIIAYYKGAQ